MRDKNLCVLHVLLAFSFDLGSFYLSILGIKYIASPIKARGRLQLERFFEVMMALRWRLNARRVLDTYPANPTLTDFFEDFVMGNGLADHCYTSKRFQLYLIFSTSFSNRSSPRMFSRKGSNFEISG